MWHRGASGAAAEPALTVYALFTLFKWFLVWNLVSEQGSSDLIRVTRYVELLQHEHLLAEAVDLHGSEGVTW